MSNVCVSAKTFSQEVFYLHVSDVLSFQSAISVLSIGKFGHFIKIRM